MRSLREQAERWMRAAELAGSYAEVLHAFGELQKVNAELATAGRHDPESSATCPCPRSGAAMRARSRDRRLARQAKEAERQAAGYVPGPPDAERLRDLLERAREAGPGAPDA